MKKDSSIILRILFVVCLFQLIAGSLYAPASLAQCPEGYPIDCGNGYCCPSIYPICGTGADTGNCFSGGTTTTTPGGGGGCPADYPVDCGNGYCCPSNYPVCGTGENIGKCGTDDSGATTTVPSGSTHYHPLSYDVYCPGRRNYHNDSGSRRPRHVSGCNQYNGNRCSGFAATLRNAARHQPFGSSAAHGLRRHWPAYVINHPGQVFPAA